MVEIVGDPPGGARVGESGVKGQVDAKKTRGCPVVKDKAPFAGLDEEGLDVIRAMRVFMNSTFYGTDGPGFGDIFADTERDTDTE